MVVIAVSLATAREVAPQYFPPSDPTTESDRTALSAFAGFFRAIGEPSLSAKFDGSYAVRVSVFAPGRLTTLKLESLRGGEVKSVFKEFIFLRDGINRVPTTTTESQITNNEFLRLMAEIRREDFFSIGTADYIATGGDEWLIEINDGNKYHSVFRPAKERNTQFGRIAAVAADIAHVNLEK